MNQKFNIVPDSGIDSALPSNDNKSGGLFPVFEEGQAPTIDFQLLDGTSHFLRTTHILHGEIIKSDINKPESIKILFSTHTVLIKGYCLQEIYNLIRADKLVRLKENDKRYMNMVEENEPFVTQIEIIWRKDEGQANSPDD